jgi:hypothetical protein
MEIPFYSASGEEHPKVKSAPEGLPNADGPGCAAGAADDPNGVINIFPSIPLQVKNTRKSSQCLKDCMMEMNVAVPLVLLMAQQGNCMVHQETEKDHSLNN